MIPKRISVHNNVYHVNVNGQISSVETYLEKCI